jgi:hypothetical protein
MLCVETLRASLTDLAAALWVVLTTLVEVATLTVTDLAVNARGQATDYRKLDVPWNQPVAILPPGHYYSRLAHLKQTRPKSNPLARYCTTTITDRVIHNPGAARTVTWTAAALECSAGRHLER